jgi:hypothetical protein
MFFAPRRSFVALTGVVTLSTLVSGTALAQSEEDRAAARALANQGVTSFNEGRFAEACDRFARAESLLHAPTHVLYLGRCAEKQSQLIRARELWLKLVREGLPTTAPQAFRDARNQARSEALNIESRLASVVITVKAPLGVKPQVEMDGKPVSTAVLGVPVPADPGQHQLIASAPGYQSQPLVITLTEGGKGNVELLVTAEGAAAVQPTEVTPVPVPTKLSAITEPPRSPATHERPSWRRPASYVALGVGAVGLGAGLYFGLDSRRNRKDARPCVRTLPSHLERLRKLRPLVPKGGASR